MKRILTCLFFFIFLFSSFTSYGQSYRQQFEKNIAQSDSLSLHKILQQWENEMPDDPSLYPAWLNYYYRFGKSSQIALGNNPPSEGDILVVNDSLQKAVGYIYEYKSWNNKLLEQGFLKIDEGIEKYPDRLDFRFGKAYALFDMEAYQDGVKTLIDVVNRSAMNGNRWLWDNNEQLPNEKESLFDSLQDYFGRLYELGEVHGVYTYAKCLVDIVLKHYPHNVVFRSNLGALYVGEKRYKEALKEFLSALADAPGDCVILSNVAYVYRLLGDKQNAILYYKKLSACDDQYYQELAKQSLKELTTEKK